MGQAPSFADFARDLGDHSPDALIALALDGRVLFWSRGATTIFGYESDEAVGKIIHDLIVAEDKRDEAKRKLAEVAVQGSLAFETTRRSKNGSHVVVNVSQRLVRDEHGHPLYVAVNTKDVTNLRRDASGDALFRALLEAAPDATVIVGKDGRIVLVNKQAEKLFGYDRDELIGECIERLMPRRFSRSHAAQRNGYAAHPAARQMGERQELWALRKDGTEVQVEIALSSAKTAQGALVFAAVRDVTDRIRTQEALNGAHTAAVTANHELAMLKERIAREKAEAALCDAEARFRRLAESGILGVVTSDVEGNVIDANDAYLRMVGYSRDELARGAVKWTDLMPREPELNDRVVAQLRATGVATPWETGSFRKDGTAVPLLVGVAMLEHPKCAAFVVDLTERQEANLARERAERALHEKEEELRQMQKMEAIGRLASGVAHDFNNVLAVILSYTEMLLAETTSSHPMRGELEEIRDAGNRAADLTRQLLLFSRKQAFEVCVVDVNAALAGVAKMLRRLVGEDIEIKLTLSASRSAVNVASGSLQQLVMNVAVNARDVMPNGGKLTIGTTNVVLDEEYVAKHANAKCGPHVCLTIRDTGAGMDAATRARVFEPFFTTKERGKGTGLGLSTVFGIVQQSGGSICIDSEVGKGTAFTIYLPLSDSPSNAQRPRVLPAGRGSETILLVEDEEHVREVTRRILQDYGYRVVVAANGEAALRLCDELGGDIDLVLSDIVMPNVGGLELARRLELNWPMLKVAYMSGHTDARCGDAPFIQKPFTADALARLVRQVLDSPARAPDVRQSA